MKIIVQNHLKNQLKMIKNIQQIEEETSVKIQSEDIEELEKLEESEDELIIKVIASDNLVNRSFYTWDVGVLQQMVNDAHTMPVLINHNWNDVWCGVGHVVDAKLNTLDEIPKNYRQMQKMEKYNQQIVEREGFNQVEMILSIGKNEEEIIEKVKYKNIKNVSTGGWLIKSDLICPICSESHGRKVSFWEQDKNDEYICPHLIPSNWGNIFTTNEESLYAPYAIMDGVYDSCEISLVNIPNLPGTGII